MKEKELNRWQELLKLGDDFDMISYYISIEKEINISYQKKKCNV